MTAHFPTLVVLCATLLATLAAFTLIWAFSIRLKDAGIVDFYWGPGFAVIGWLAWWLDDARWRGDLVFLGLLTLWALRLGWHMTARHVGVEDARYADMRARHGPAFGKKSLWMVFWLQALIQWLASSPALVLVLSDPTEKAALLASPVIGLAVATGMALFILGLGLEIAADRAISRFKADPANRGRLLTTGLHARIRHPNYLGEIILQWGLGIMAFGMTLNPLAFVGPALMHGLIVNLSGVPMLEAQFESRPGFAAWKARTNPLWPRFGG
jgi:steroid 5-alpha reductase family enzyme